MAIVKVGTFTVTSGGTAQNLNLGFQPSYFYMVNLTNVATPANDELVKAEWFAGMSNGTGIGTNYTGTQPAIEINNIAANGFTPFQTADSALWTATNLTITNISQAAQATVTATNSLAAGDIVSFHGVVGMTQINTLVGEVVSAVGASFVVDIDTTGFTAYSSGGIANVIDGVNYGLNSTAVQGNAGIIGLTLGTTLMVTTSDVWRYVATLDAPFTS